MRAEKEARLRKRQGQGAQQLGTRLIGQQCVLHYAMVVVEVAVVAAVVAVTAVVVLLMVVKSHGMTLCLKKV